MATSDHRLEKLFISDRIERFIEHSSEQMAQLRVNQAYVLDEAPADFKPTLPRAELDADPLGKGLPHRDWRIEEKKRFGVEQSERTTGFITSLIEEAQGTGWLNLPTDEGFARVPVRNQKELENAIGSYLQDFLAHSEKAREGVAIDARAKDALRSRKSLSNSEAGKLLYDNRRSLELGEELDLDMDALKKICREKEILILMKKRDRSPEDLHRLNEEFKKLDFIQPAPLRAPVKPESPSKEGSTGPTFPKAVMDALAEAKTSVSSSGSNAVLPAKLTSRILTA